MTDLNIMLAIFLVALVFCWLALCIAGGGPSPPPGYGYRRPWWKVLLGNW